ncbi:MAG: hypothetical protein ACK55I_13685, partial [bacterium]
ARRRLPLPHPVERLTCRSNAEDGSEFFPEHDTCAEDGHTEEDHGPDAEGAGDEAAFAEELIQFVDRLGNGKVLLALGEEQ